MSDPALMFGKGTPKTLSALLMVMKWCSHFCILQLQLHCQKVEFGLVQLFSCTQPAICMSLCRHSELLDMLIGICNMYIQVCVFLIFW